MKRFLASLSALALLLSACGKPSPYDGEQVLPPLGSASSASSASLSATSVSMMDFSQTSLPSLTLTAKTGAFGATVSYNDPKITANTGIAADFSTADAKNLAEIEKAYGMTLSPAQKEMLSKNKFLMLNLLDTTIQPGSSENSREFVDLYTTVAGPDDYKNRSQANTLFLSSDVFFNAYNNLYVELLKEMENKVFFTSMGLLSKNFYEASREKLATATTDTDKLTWTQVRNYYAVPYAIFSTSAKPLSNEDYYQDGQQIDPAQVQADFTAKDKTVDTAANASAFIKNLKLDAASEKAILVDISHIYAASGKEKPEILKKEFDDYAQKMNVDFSIDFTQFTPRGTYTSSSLRRAYFRGMNWFIQVPFFVESAQLTKDAFAVTQLMAEHPDDLARYNQLEAAINFMVGRSDDLIPSDYLEALQNAKGKTDQEAALLTYLRAAHDPAIKSVAAAYPTIGDTSTSAVLQKTKGMRFFSGKFIIDSFWTGQLTQGDEAIKPGYTQKLPPMASSLEVMALLGSDYAKSKIPTLDFYKAENAKAIDQAMTELTASTAKLDTAFWQSNLYNGWLWTIKGLFSWQKENKTSLPQFMQSPLWDTKTLMTGAGFWTELRHATILYAKQSFAELGGGPPACDDRKIPEPPKSYIEPQPLAYARLQYLAKRTSQGLRDQGYADILQNLGKMDSFVSLMDVVQNYTKKQLGNTALLEKTSSHQETDDYGTTCTVYTIDGESDWEVLRVHIVDGLKSSLPVPTEGPVLSAKDHRAAILADVHTGGDSSNPPRILYEGTGVPTVILVAIKDVNGPRYSIGFTYSQYEFTEPYGGNRMTDEDWQQKFYTGEEPYQPYEYTPKGSRPALNTWYQPLFEAK